MPERTSGRGVAAMIRKTLCGQALWPGMASGSSPLQRMDDILLHRCQLVGMLDLVAETVAHIKGIDGAFAVSGDDGRRDRKAGIEYRPRHVVKQARPVQPFHFDHRGGG